jgi:hypothetical protein
LIAHQFRFPRAEKNQHWLDFEWLQAENKQQVIAKAVYYYKSWLQPESNCDGIIRDMMICYLSHLLATFMLLIITPSCNLSQLSIKGGNRNRQINVHQCSTFLAEISRELKCHCGWYR